MKILFWNTHNNNIGEYVSNIAKDYSIDIVILAEVNDNKNSITDNLELLEWNYIEANTVGCKGIEIWSRGYTLTPFDQAPRYSIQVIDNSYILCCMHLQSNLHYSENERLETIRYIIDDVKRCENNNNLHKIIYIGDMNEMPYNIGCIGANGLHGLPILSVDETPYRMVQDKKYRKFYNPMWNCFGDDNDPPGTFYFKESVLNNPMWHILDQVIISQELIPFFERSSLKILNNTSVGRLDDRYGRPKVSDHFPIICEIRDEHKKEEE